MIDWVKVFEEVKEWKKLEREIELILEKEVVNYDEVKEVEYEGKYNLIELFN